jgi:hypothetical protein
MPATPISSLVELLVADLADTDWLVVVDRSDTTMGAGGTDKKLQAASFGLASRVAALETITEVAVTGTVTLTATALGKVHVCSGTAADYTVVLPTAVGQAGRTIGFRMSDALTKLVTLDGSGTQTINGQAVRVLHSGEVVTLQSDGANWVKVGTGVVTLPLICSMRLSSATPSTAQSIPNATVPLAKVLLNVPDIDSTGMMADAAGNRIVIPRTGRYRIDSSLRWASIGPATRVFSQVLVDGTGTPCVDEATVYTSGSFVSNNASYTMTLTTGQAVTLHAFQNTGGPVYLFGDPVDSSAFLTVTELPTW